MEQILTLTDTVRETSFQIHSYLRHGHFERIYENSLFGRLRRLGLHVEQQYPLDVFDEDATFLGHYVADLFVERCLIVEVKAVRTLLDEHIAQVLGYLRASRLRHGMLVNFGAPRLQVKKLIL